MSMTLLSKRNGPMQLPPATKGGKPRVWPGNTTITVDDKEGQELLKYHHVVQLKDGEQVRGPKGADPVPSGTGLAGKAAPVEKDDKKK